MRYQSQPAVVPQQLTIQYFRIKSTGFNIIYQAKFAYSNLKLEDISCWFKTGYKKGFQMEITVNNN